MLIDQLQRRLFSAPDLGPALAALDSGGDVSIGLSPSARPLLVAALFARGPRPIIVVVSGEDAAERFARELAVFLGRARVMRLPERTDFPWSDVPPDLATVGRRTRAIGSLALGRPAIVVASARALLRRVAPAPAGAGGIAGQATPPNPQSSVPPSPQSTASPFAPLVVSRASGLCDAATGEVLGRDDLAGRLTARGYERLERLDGPGTFTLRGDTADVFAAGETSPVRIEFFGDDIDGLRRVVATTGQSIGELDVAELWPAREYALTPDAVARARTTLKVRSITDADTAEHLDMLDAGIPFPEMDVYLPALFEEPAQPIAHAAAETLVVLAEPRSLFDDATCRHDDLAARADSVRLPRDVFDGLFAAPSHMDFGGQQRLTIQSMIRVGAKVDVDIPVERPRLQGREEKLFSTLRGLALKHTTTLLCIPDRHARSDMELVLTDNSVPFVERLDSAAPAVTSSPDSTSDIPKPDTPGTPDMSDTPSLSSEYTNVCDLDVPTGFILPTCRVALISLFDLNRAGSRSAARSRRAARTIDITEMTFPFEPGDYVVHESHGIALFKGLVEREVAGEMHDYLELSYAASDKLFVPVEQIDRITRYVGPDSSSPRLTRLGSADWVRASERARASAKKLAFDLVDLYARRSTVKGFAYSPDDAFTAEMEAIFPYEETPDQKAAIADVKADMESERPMDRLICGDVGFGKTEVALRAAAKAVTDGRQVMVLCPTTILAQQHYDTFNDRFSPFGITVEVLSRFRTTSQQKKALAGFADGSVDVLVGTHRLLSRDVNPKTLGLIVIDEEQRFGVAHKEQLKNLRESVDVLTLTATPIPRTLQMSLSGVRDMSLITTPPPGRRPVEVHVGEFDEDVVSGAIRREMARGGQVYYVSNRVKTIDDARAAVIDAAPEARVDIAHGQMKPAEVEDVMERFSAGEIDVLVSTTIVESGLDNPHTNTLIIEDSQHLGLAQLYQLKGRVGRSRNQAYAYFLFPAGERLTDEATERLQAIGEYTELGSGMQVAMRDLEIRGAGSILGADQSGNMSAVGFDLFASMLAEAVSAARGEGGAAEDGGGGAPGGAVGRGSGSGSTAAGGDSGGIAHEGLHVEVAASYLIPEEYMPAADERVLFYRRIASAVTVGDVERVESQMFAAHGQIPREAANMLERAKAKSLAAECGVTSVAQTGGRLVFTPVPPELQAAARDALDAAGARCFVKSSKVTVPVAADDAAGDGGGVAGGAGGSGAGEDGDGGGVGAVPALAQAVGILEALADAMP